MIYEFIHRLFVTGFLYPKHQNCYIMDSPCLFVCLSLSPSLCLSVDGMVSGVWIQFGLEKKAIVVSIGIFLCYSFAAYWLSLLEVLLYIVYYFHPNYWSRAGATQQITDLNFLVESLIAIFVSFQVDTCSLYLVINTCCSHITYA